MHYSPIVGERSGFPVTKLLDDVRNTEVSIANPIVFSNAHTSYTRDTQSFAYFGDDTNIHEHGERGTAVPCSQDKGL